MYYGNKKEYFLCRIQGFLSSSRMFLDSSGRNMTGTTFTGGKNKVS